MEQQTELIDERTPWVLVSSLLEKTTEDDLTRIAPQIRNIVDDWQSKGRIIWSGGFNDNKSSMAVFEATDLEAKELYTRYNDICTGVLTFALYQWDAMPILSILSN